MINQVNLLGRLTKDVEVKHSPQGNPYGKFGVATSHYYKKEETTTFHNVVVFGQNALNCDKYLKKGDLVFISGRIENKSYEDNGVKKFFSQVVADQVKFMPKGKGSSDQSRNDTHKAPEYTDTDIPF